MFFRLFTLCSTRVCGLVSVLNDSPCERIGKWETCPILKEDRFDVYSAGSSVTKTTTLLGLSRATASKVISSYTMGRYQQRGRAGEEQH
jgi:hypothetical protein